MMEENTTLSNILVEDYNEICNQVMDYMLDFSSDDAEIQKNFTLKRDHIHRVIGYTEVISRSLECNDETILIAQLAALMHDIGRFMQFEKYQTFNDSVSLDHSELAVTIINEKGWLKKIDPEIQTIIKEAVLLHNKISIPKNTKKEIELIAKILRDADKVDILDLSTKDYGKTVKNKAITLNLEISSNVSKQVAKSLSAEKLPAKKDMTTVTEFKLMQMAFVFDINFKETFSIINKKGYIKKIFETLPKTDQVFEVYRKAKIHVENHLI